MLGKGSTVRHEGALRRVLSVVDETYLAIDTPNGPALVDRSRVIEVDDLSAHELRLAIDTVVPSHFGELIARRIAEGDEEFRAAVEKAYRELFPPLLVEALRKLQLTYGPEGVALCAIMMGRMPGLLESLATRENPLPDDG